LQKGNRILPVICKNCQKNIDFREWVNDRIELANKKGNEFEIICKKCHQKPIIY
jgi:RNase P subunit RPR2